MKSLIKQKSVGPLLIGLLFSSLATNIVQFAISLWVLDQTGSTSLFANVLVAALVAKIICTPLSGGLIDRYSKKAMMIFLDCAYLVLTIGLIIVAFKVNMILAIIIYSVLVGALSALETPVVQATVPLIVEQDDLMMLNGLVSQITVLSGIFGPILAGILYKSMTFTELLGLASVGFVLAIGAEVTLMIRATTVQPISMTQNLKNTMKFLTNEGSNIGQMAILAGLINLVVTAFIEIAIPVIFRLRYHFTAFAFGILQGGLAISVLLAAALTTVIIKKIKVHNMYRLMIGSMIPLLITGFTLFVSNKSVTIGFLIFSFFTIQFIFTAISIVIISKIQSGVKNEQLGSVMAIVMLGAMVALPLGEGIYGQIFGLLTMNWEIGCLLILIALMMMIIAWCGRKIFTNVK